MNAPVRLERNGSTLDISLVPWDSEIFGFAVAQIDHLDFGAAVTTSALFADLDAWCADHDVRLISCRLDHGRLRESMTLERVGFRFVETVYGPRLGSFDRIGDPSHVVDVAEASPGDVGSIEAIASSAFTTGRFLLDPRLDPGLSQRRYANWVRTSFDDPRHTVLKAEAGGDLIAFFIVEPRTDGSVYWHLTAMAPQWQGKGLSLSVWQTMLLRHRSQGATVIETTISGHNLATINLYARLGFSFASSQMTFHRLLAVEG